MAKTEVVLCDKCKQKVAIGKCCYCKEDVCEKCSDEICVIGMIAGEGTIVEIRKTQYSHEKGSKIYLCDECVAKFKDAFRGLKGEEKVSLIKDLLTTYVQHLTISKL